MANQIQTSEFLSWGILKIWPNFSSQSFWYISQYFPWQTLYSDSCSLLHAFHILSFAQTVPLLGCQDAKSKPCFMLFWAPKLTADFPKPLWSGYWYDCLPDSLELAFYLCYHILQTRTPSAHVWQLQMSWNWNYSQLNPVPSSPKNTLCFRNLYLRGFLEPGNKREFLTQSFRDVWRRKKNVWGGGGWGREGAVVITEKKKEDIKEILKVEET